MFIEAENNPNLASVLYDMGVKVQMDISTLHAVFTFITINDIAANACIMLLESCTCFSLLCNLLRREITVGECMSGSPTPQEDVGIFKGDS